MRKQQCLCLLYTSGNGNLTESPVRTNPWAWRPPHKAEGTVTYQRQEGGVVFDDVDFGYDEDKIVLHNITLYAKPGQKIAFVGATGAGKTTITNLINRFYDIADGKIRYDGININKIRKPDLRRSLGMVLQDTHLFTGTVMDNIRYGKLDATDEECIRAAKLANADGFIRRLPDGYNTMLTGDGANLSPVSYTHLDVYKRQGDILFPVSQALFCGQGGLQDELGVAQELDALAGQRHGFAGPEEQLCPQFLFQRLDLVGDCRLGDLQHLGGF